jgi:hypothetical protein
MRCVCQAAGFYAGHFVRGRRRLDDALLDILLKVDTIFVGQKENFGNLGFRKHI